MDDVKSLYEECICYISSNIQLILTYYESKQFDIYQVFNNLPPTACEILVKSVNRSLLNPTILKYLIRRGIKRLELDFYNYCLPVNEIGYLTEKITHLNIAYSSIPEENINDLVLRLPNVLHLDLKKTNTTDLTLDSVGRNCHLLEFLDVSLCPITNTGIYNICHNPNNRNEKRCVRLKQLSILTKNVTIDGLVHALECLPLSHVETDNLCLQLALSRFLQTNQICYFVNLLLDLNEKELDFSKILTSSPHLEKLYVFNIQTTHKLWNGLPKYSNLSILILSASSRNDEFPNSIFQFLHVSCPNLSRLWLTNFCNVNIYLIGLYCEKLTALRFDNTCHLHFVKEEWTHSLVPLFNFLEKLQIQSSTGDDVYLESILENSPMLKELRMVHTNFIGEDKLSELGPYLDKIQSLFLICCDNVTVSTPYVIIEYLTSLKRLHIVYRTLPFSKTEKEMLIDYGKNKNYNLSCCIRSMAYLENGGEIL